MKRMLTLFGSLAMSLVALANQISIVPPRIAMEQLDGGRQRTEATATFRELRLSLSVVAGPKGTPLESIGGAVEGAAFQVDLSDFPQLEGVRSRDIILHADCCIMGASFYWYIPYGEKNARCSGDGPTKRQRGRWRKEIRIEVDGEGKVADVRIYELCMR